MPREIGVPLESLTRDVLQLFDEEVDWISKIMAYARKNKKVLFYRVLATTANLLKCLGHPPERRSKVHNLRKRPVPEALRKPNTKGKELILGSLRKPIVARLSKAPRKPVTARVFEAPRRPTSEKGKRKMFETKYVKDRAFMWIEDEPKNPQIPSLKKRKSDELEAGSGVGNAFTNIMGASQKTFSTRPMIRLTVDLRALLGDRPSRPLTIKTFGSETIGGATTISCYSHDYLYGVIFVGFQLECPTHPKGYKAAAWRFIEN